MNASASNFAGSGAAAAAARERGGGGGPVLETSGQIARHYSGAQHYTTMQTRNAGGHRLTGVHRSLPAPAPLRRRCVRKPVHLIIRIRSCRSRAAAAAAPLPAKFEAEA
uniref:SFRICE_037817 n=1 Tax=Spodoptera frugiperda TaxID=7108 RepID=A0A2H1WLX9_SPOFR